MKCKIKMTTTQEEYIPEQLINAMFGEENEGAPSTERDTFEIYAEGEIVKQENKVIIRYEEGEASGLGGSVAELFFDKSEPKNITLTRTGGVSVIMCFKEGSRHTCVYNTEVMPVRRGNLRRSRGGYGCRSYFSRARTFNKTRLKRKTFYQQHGL